MTMIASKARTTLQGVKVVIPNIFIQNIIYLWNTNQYSLPISEIDFSEPNHISQKALTL
jgi:hypothetical protein